MHILVTRPFPDAWETQAQLTKLGHTVTLCPLLEIVPEELDPQVVEGASAIVATSQNGLRTLQLSGLADRVRRLQVYAVGEATAGLAEAMKLPNITAGRGTAASLVPVIAERQKSRTGHVVHLAGDHLAFDLSGALESQGVNVRTVTAYRSIAATSLPMEAVGALKSRKAGAVMLMSPRTAETWAALTQAAGLHDELKPIVHVCLSDAVAAKLQQRPGLKVEVAQEPNSAEMLSLLKGLAASASRE